MSPFANNLRFLRKRGGHNQEDIAILFNKRANTVGNWENQKSEPSLGELMKLADFFKVSTEDLLQTDLESASRKTLGHLPATVASGQVTNVQEVRELSRGTDTDPEPDAFWLILREIRALHAKLDQWVADTTSSGTKKNSDKSYY